jgi:nucleotide-binding universal stress UspA family protein
MYKRILIATDGSERSDRAIEQGVALAKSIGASVVGLNAAPSFRIYAGSVADITNTMEADYRNAAEERARIYLEKVEKAAQKAGVPCETHYLYGEPIHQSIINALGEYNCDLAVMASHGRGSVGSLLLGSVTQKVLAHGEHPVLVVR